MQEGQRKRQLLPHASGEMLRQARAGALQADALEEFLRPRLEARATQAVGAGDEGDVLVDAQIRVQSAGARDVAEAASFRSADGALRRPDSSGQGAQQRRLAGPVAAEHGGHGAGRDVKRDVLERRPAAEAHREALHAPGWSRHRSALAWVSAGARSRRNRQVDRANTPTAITARTVSGIHNALIGASRTMTPRATLMKYVSGRT